jgi:hypothetical protein
MSNIIKLHQGKLSISQSLRKLADDIDANEKTVDTLLLIRNGDNLVKYDLFQNNDVSIPFLLGLLKLTEIMLLEDSGNI